MYDTAHQERDEKLIYNHRLLVCGVWERWSVLYAIRINPAPASAATIGARIQANRRFDLANERNEFQDWSTSP